MIFISQVMGSKGMLVSSNPKQTSLERWTPDGTIHESTYFSCMERYADSYQHEIRHFLNVLEGKVERLLDAFGWFKSCSDLHTLNISHELTKGEFSM